MGAQLKQTGNDVLFLQLPLTHEAVPLHMKPLLTDPKNRAPHPHWYRERHTLTGKPGLTVKSWGRLTYAKYAGARNNISFSIYNSQMRFNAALNSPDSPCLGCRQATACQPMIAQPTCSVALPTPKSQTTCFVAIPDFVKPAASVNTELHPRSPSPAPTTHKTLDRKTCTRHPSKRQRLQRQLFSWSLSPSCAAKPATEEEAVAGFDTSTPPSKHSPTTDQCRSGPSTI